MNDHDYYRYDDYLDEDNYDYPGSQEMTREEKFWFVLVFVVFMFVAVAMACGGVYFF